MQAHAVQLRSGGRLIGTPDVAGLQFQAVEDFVNEKVVTPPRRLSPRNSRMNDHELGLAGDFTVGHLVIDCVA